MNIEFIDYASITATSGTPQTPVDREIINFLKDLCHRNNIYFVVPKEGVQIGSDFPLLTALSSQESASSNPQFAFVKRQMRPDDMNFSWSEER